MLIEKVVKTKQLQINLELKQTEQQAFSWTSKLLIKTQMFMATSDIENSGIVL